MATEYHKPYRDIEIVTVIPYIINKLMPNDYVCIFNCYICNWNKWNKLNGQTLFVITLHVCSSFSLNV